MGANAQTTVPTFTASQVLTADQQNQSARTGVPVFAGTTERDAAFGGAGEKTLAQGQFCYLESTGKLQVYTGSAWSNVGTTTNVQVFTASGTWTVPAGVTYAIANIRGGGGGAGSASSGDGGTSSVAFAAGTISATGGKGMIVGTNGLGISTAAGQANSGNPAYFATDNGSSKVNNGSGVGHGTYIVAGGVVSPAASITITIGAGGTAGTNGSAGGSGYIWITYEV